MAEPLKARIARLAGIETGHHDLLGTYHPTSPEARDAMLAGMGFPVADAADREAARRALEDGPWLDWLPPVVVLRQGRHLEVPLSLPERAGQDILDWKLELEDGDLIEGVAEAEHLHRVANRAVDGERRFRCLLPLTPKRARPLPPGYHRLSVRGNHGLGRTTLILAPAACWLPPGMAHGGRLWGTNCHLYALRAGPSRDVGMGTFSQLAELAAGTAKLGGSVVGLNPLHALFPQVPDHASPYSPSSRLFLNPLYIDPRAVPEWAGLDDPEAALDAKAARRLGRRDEVDYAGVDALLRPAFQALFERFEATADPDSERHAAFTAFLEAGGEPLARFAIHQALAERHGPHWTSWPAALRDPFSAEVARFAEAHAREVRHHAWLQFEADRQLAAAAEAGRRAGLDPGLYRDLAVGVAGDGADAWIDPGLYCLDVRFGAPPDAFNPYGQDWGLPPLNPHALKADAYRPFTAMLRANMAHAGAIRIDHAMSLMRLYWIPAGADGRSGSYVRYPLDDLMGVLALESHRQKCLVIGEDLGTVPAGFPERMAAENVLSYRLFYFQRWESGLFRRPELYPAKALATPGSHDMYTIVGHWQGTDVDLTHQLEVVAEGAEVEADRAERAADRRRLVDALVDQKLLPVDFPVVAELDEARLADLMVAIHAFLARSPAHLMLVNVDDLALEERQLNLPGTVDAYPNWRRRLGKPVKGLLGSDLAQRLAAAIRQAR